MKWSPFELGLCTLGVTWLLVYWFCTVQCLKMSSHDSNMLLPFSHTLCSCHSNRNFVLLQIHRGPQTCLRQATHSCACPSFGRLDICISQQSRADDSRTVCSQWSSWSCVPPMSGLSFLYRWFARLSVRISPDSLLALSLNCAECTRLGIE